jgi:hypothetical protein
MPFAVGLLAAGAAISVLGSFNQAAATEDAARFNNEAAEEDIKLVRIEESQKRRVLREKGAFNLGAIITAGAASGVKVNSGSILDAVIKQASVNAQEEFLLGFESRSAQQRIRQAAVLGSGSAANQAAGQRLSGIGAGLSGAGAAIAAS